MTMLKAPYWSSVHLAAPSTHLSEAQVSKSHVGLTAESTAPHTLRVALRARACRRLTPQHAGVATSRRAARYTSLHDARERLELNVLPEPTLITVMRGDRYEMRLDHAANDPQG